MGPPPCGFGGISALAPNGANSASASANSASAKSAITGPHPSPLVAYTRPNYLSTTPHSHTPPGHWPSSHRRTVTQSPNGVGVCTQA